METFSESKPVRRQLRRFRAENTVDSLSLADVRNLSLNDSTTFRIASC